jgi:sulfatase modifying factor 1
MGRWTASTTSTTVVRAQAATDPRSRYDLQAEAPLLLLSLLLACFGGPAGDADGDGLDDAREAALGADPNNPDSDGDGQPDGIEVDVHHTNPTNPDSDGDGVFDGEEIATRRSNPLVADAAPAPAVGQQVEVHGVVVQDVPPGTALVTPDQPLPPELRCETRGSNSGCFIYVPGGAFWMGAQAADPAGRGYDPHARPDEGPVHEVTVKPFRLQRYEVNEGQFAICVREGWCKAEDVLSGGFGNYGQEGKGDHPINGLTWEGARRMCAFVGGRLPTEAEWELAARGSDGRWFPWGNVPQCGVFAADPSAQEGAKFNENSDAPHETCENDGTAPFGRLRWPSALGLYGMGGSVWEWTADWYAPDAYARHDKADPKGPASGETRVQRGGGWASLDAWELRAAARGSLRPDQKLHDVGVRCARDVVGDAP